MLPHLRHDVQLAGLGEVSTGGAFGIALLVGMVSFLAGLAAGAKATGLGGLGSDAMQEGKKKSLLAKPIRFEGRQMTKAQWIEELVRRDGRLYTDRFQKYDFNRTKFNRMDNAEQAEYTKKMAIKMPFAVMLPNGSYFEVTQTEAEYFTSLGGQRA